MNSDDSIKIGLIILGAIGAISLVGFVVTFFSRQRPVTVARQTVRAVFAAILGMMVVVMVALGAGLSGDAGLGLRIVLGILAGVLLLFFIISIIAGKLGWNWIFFRKYWDIQKAFGGGMFGDFANTVGVLSGIGAYQLTHADPGWFWLGQLGALLAMLVGLSLALRVYLDTLENDPVRSTKFRAFYAIANLSVGCFTLLSLLSPVTSNPPETLELSKIMGRVWLGIEALMLVFSFLLFMWDLSATETVYPDPLPSLSRRLIGLIYIFPVLLVFGTLLALLTWQLGLNPPAWLQALFGWLAIWSWLAIEVAALAEIRKDQGLSTTVRIFRNERGVAIIYGNLCIFALSVWIFAILDTVSQYGPVHWVLFTQGVTFLTLATLTGIILAANSTAQKAFERRRRARVRVIEAENPNPFVQPVGSVEELEEAFEMSTIHLDE